MKPFHTRPWLRRVNAVVISLACCAAAAACDSVDYDQLSSGDTKPPPVVETVWDVRVDASEEAAKAAIDGEELFVWGQSKGDLTAYGLATGDEMWDAGAEVENAWVTENVIVVETEDGDVQALDRESGERRFALEGAEYDDKVAVTTDGVAVLGKKDREAVLTFYDIDSGEKVWSKEVDGSPTRSTSVLAPTESPHAEGRRDSVEERIRIAQESPLIYVSDDLEEHYAIHSVANGEQNGSVDVDISNSTDGFATMTDEGNVLTLVQTEDCTAGYVVVNEEFTEIEVFNMYGGHGCPNSPTSAQRNFTDGKLYGLTSSDKPYLIDVDTGDVMWTASEEGSPATFTDGVATYERDGYLKAIDVESAVGENERLWEWDFNSIEFPPNYGRLGKRKIITVTGVDYHADAGGGVAVMGNEEFSCAVDIKDGEPLWTFPGAILDLNDEYVVLQEGYGDDQTLQVSPIGD